MNTITNKNSEYKSNSLRKKSSFRRDGSYRIFHITKKQKEESDDDENSYIKNGQTINKENDIKPKYQKKSFKMFNRNGLDGWKGKTTKNKRLLFHKTSSESIKNDLSPSIISNNVESNQLLMNNKQHDEQNKDDESYESDALRETIDETIAHDDATLNDLLARADKLEITFKKQDFNKIQPLSRANLQRKGKRFIIACGTVLLLLTIIITIIIFVVIMTLRYKAQTKQVSNYSSIDSV